MSLEIGRAIRIIRQAKEMKLSDLAKSADLSVPYLSLIESGDRQPSMDALARIAGVLAIPVEALMILAQPIGGSLSSQDRIAQNLTDAVRRMAEAEELLRSRLVKEGRNASRRNHA